VDGQPYFGPHSERIGGRDGTASARVPVMPPAWTAGTAAAPAGERYSSLAELRVSLRIAERVGDRRAAADAQNRLGALLTRAGRPGDAVRYTLAGLSGYLALGSPDATRCLPWLRRQLELLGATAFTAALRAHVPEGSAEQALSWVEGLLRS
jgi:hypothetical protein